MKVNGIGKLESAFNKKLAAVARNVAGAVAEGVGRIASDARALAPQRTGDLDASIVATPARAKGGRVSASVVATGGHDTPMVGSVEYGDRDNAPQPFMRPAFNRNVDPIAEAIADAVRGA